MLRRSFVHIYFIFLFAFTQIGVATHEISHLSNFSSSDLTSQSQTEKNTAHEQCAQCIAYAQIANGLIPPQFFIAFEPPLFQLHWITFARLTSFLVAPYSARAPPFSSIS